MKRFPSKKIRPTSLFWVGLFCVFLFVSCARLMKEEEYQGALVESMPDEVYEILPIDEKREDETEFENILVRDKETESKETESKEEERVSRREKKMSPVPAPESMPTPVSADVKSDLEVSELGAIDKREKETMSFPFRVGEKVTLEIRYLGMRAGEMTLEVRPNVSIKGEKTARFFAHGKTSSFFSRVYSVDDSVEAFWNIGKQRAMSYRLTVRQSRQLRDTRSEFHWDRGIADFWDHRVRSGDDVRVREYEWELPEEDFVQNVFTAPFFMRTQELYVGEEFSFPVAHQNRNLELFGKVLRREKISVPAGEFDTWVVQPRLELDGDFRPMGDILVWLTADERRFIVRVEGKIRIGTLHARAVRITP